MLFGVSGWLVVLAPTNAGGGTVFPGGGSTFSYAYSVFGGPIDERDGGGVVPVALTKGRGNEWYSVAELARRAPGVAPGYFGVFVYFASFWCMDLRIGFRGQFFHRFLSVSYRRGSLFA